MTQETTSTKGVQLASDIILLRGEEVFLLKRKDTGQWCLPGGRLDPGESSIDGALREAQEETGVLIKLEDLEMIHIEHGIFLHGEMVIFGFLCEQWSGEPINAEPHKADEGRWFHKDKLPSPMTKWHSKLLTNYLDIPTLTFDECL